MSDLFISTIIDTGDVQDALLDQFSQEELLDFVATLDDTVGDWDFTRALRDYFVKEMQKIADEEDDTEEKEPTPWPMNLSASMAVHETIEYGDCGAYNPLNCLAVDHRLIETTINHNNTWLKHRGVDVDELLASRGVSSKEVGR